MQLNCVVFYHKKAKMRRGGAKWWFRKSENSKIRNHTLFSQFGRTGSVQSMLRVEGKVTMVCMATSIILSILDLSLVSTGCNVRSWILFLFWLKNDLMAGGLE